MSRGNRKTGQSQEPPGISNQSHKRNRIPAKLKIKVKQLVEKDNPSFQRKWNDAISKADMKVTKVITDHLNNVIQQTNAQIRETMEKTFQILRAADIAIDQVKQALQDALVLNTLTTQAIFYSLSLF